MNTLALQPVISVVTPSYNMLGYLKRCCASVADQEGVAFEHIVMDAVSGDGTVEWLASNDNVKAVVEKDNGMYDAINKGWAQARGEIVSYLNCDEQYLPGTLQHVWEYFQAHPQVDILFGNLLLIRPDGSLISYRKGFQPRWLYILTSHLYVLSCTMFLRRRIIDDGFRFDPQFKNVGDADFVLRVLRSGYRARHVKKYLAAFAMTGANMSADANAQREKTLLWRDAPAWLRFLRLPMNGLRLMEKTLSGAYSQRMPLEYAVYNSPDARVRRQFSAQSASFRWQWK